MNTQEKFNSVFPTRLRQLLKERGTTITALAKELGISRQAVSQYADGTGQPNIDKLVLIANFFDVSTDYLTGLAEYQNSENEAVLAKDLGLSEQSVNILRFYAGYPEHPFFIPTLNRLIEQETPEPQMISCGGYGMTKEEFEESERMAEEEYEKDMEQWRSMEYSPILSSIHDFLSIERNEQKYDFLEDGEILKKREGKGIFSVRINRLRTVKSSDILERVLLSEIEDRLKKLKDQDKK